MVSRFWEWVRRQLGPSEIERARCELGRRFPGVTFGTDAQIIGLDHVQIGKGSCIGDRAWINDCVRDRAGRLSIGSFVLIGRGGVISTAGQLEIGDFTVLAPDVFIADADHIFTDPFQPILQQGATTGRCITVEENCWFGMQAKAFGNLTIGRGSVVAAGSIVRHSVPPFAVVAGTPARIVKLYDFAENSWVSVRGEGEIAAQLEKRRHAPPPEREEYRRRLHANYRLGPLEPILAGANLSV